MIENKELKIDEGSAVKNVDSGVKVGTDDSTSTPEKKRKKFARFYDWFWFVGLLIQLLNIFICYDYVYRDYIRQEKYYIIGDGDHEDVYYSSPPRRYLEDILIISIIILATYTFTWMLSKRKGNAFTGFIFTLCYGSVTFISSIVADDCNFMDSHPILFFVIAFIYWALVWNFTRKESKN